MAEKVKHKWEKPEEIVRVIFGVRDCMVNEDEKWVSKLRTKTFQFVCEHIIDADEKGDEIDLQFLMTEIMATLVRCH